MNDRCAADLQCVALTSDGAAITNQPLCYACVNLLQNRYDELPEILRVLPLFKGGMSGESGEARVSKSKGEPPLPINVGVLDVIDMIREILEDIGSLRISDLARHESGVSRALRVGWAWKQADGIIGISIAWTRRFLPCRECGQRSLGQYAGETKIHCANCGFSQTLEEYSAHIITVRKS